MEKEPAKKTLPVIDYVGKSSEDIISQEINAVLKLWDPDYIQIEHSPLKSIKVNVNYTQLKKIQIHMIYPSPEEGSTDKENYPNSNLIIKLKSDPLPHKLVEMLTRKSEAMIKKLVLDPEGAKPQVIPVFEFIRGIMENNNLIPVWDELPLIREVLRLPKKGEETKQVLDELKLMEKVGKLRVKMCEKKFFCTIDIKVPENYPAKKPELKFIEHNYDVNFAKIFEAQANQMIKKLWNGGEPTYDTINKKREIFKKENVGKLAVEMSALKTLDRNELKHDIKYMNDMQELRDNVNAGDKGAKKYIKLKEKHEAKYEDKVQAEEARLAELEAGELHEDTANPSIFHIVNYLANYFVRFLPQATCLSCNEKLVCKLKKSIQEDAMRPERSYCGHYMHYKCFDEFVNAPPFLRECPDPKCEMMFGSKNFKMDEGSVKSREKQYMQAEQKQGEESDMYRVLGGFE